MITAAAIFTLGFVAGGVAILAREWAKEFKRRK